jgi:hypothetical protein
MKKQSKPEVTVATRRLTPEEERHLSVAIDLYLVELVRQQLSRDRGQSGKTRTER